MIRITDRTLSCLDRFSLEEKQLTEFITLLMETGVDRIELSEKTYRLVRGSRLNKCVLRVQDTAVISQYPEIDQFVCRNIPEKMIESVCIEIVLNDIHETYTAARYGGCPKVRIRGLDDCLLGNFENTFEQIQKLFHGQIELCPTNRCYCSSAIATEWILSGGTDIVTSFGGIGGFAALEEVLMVLRSLRQRKAGKSYPFLPRMRTLLSEITGYALPPNKPVIGEKIFFVESGIHVDGIAKQPKCYEPFPPESVGQTRTFVIGKQSGTTSVSLKLEELGIKMDPRLLPALLTQIKRTSIEKNNSLADDEFAAIAKSVAASAQSLKRGDEDEA